MSTGTIIRTELTGCIILLMVCAAFFGWPGFPELQAFGFNTELGMDLNRLARPIRTSLFHAANLGGSVEFAKGGQQTISSCRILDRRGTEYILGQDVSSLGTCFSVQADNIVLNLNHHVISYGLGKPKSAAFGVLGIACWDSTLTNGIATGNPCGGSFDGLTVFNGSIVQAAGAAPFSDAIRLGQGGGNYLKVFDVTITVEGDSAIPIHTTFSGAGSVIRNNVIQNNVKTIQNRHQLQGTSIKFDNSQLLPKGQMVYENKIVGGPQGGILLLTQGASAYRNEIRQDAHYSNDFAIYMWGNDQEVYENLIEATSGRGIQVGGGAVGTNGEHMGGRNSRAHDNVIRVRELKQNCEYGEGAASCLGCELGGAYGIQFDDNPQGDTTYNNKVMAFADDCDGAALRVTDSETPQNESHDETFSAVRVHAGSPGVAYGWDNLGPKGFTARNDVFSGDTATYHVGWDGAQNEICLSCTLERGDQNSSPNYVTFSFQNGGKNPVQNVHFRDTRFLGGAKKDSNNLRPIDSENWPGYVEYYIDWTLTLRIHGQSRDSVSGVQVAITDASGDAAYRGETDSQGKIVVSLTEFRIYNTYTHVIQETRTPYRVELAKQGCTAETSSFYIDIKETLFYDTEIKCEGH